MNNEISYFETIKCNDYEIYNIDFHKKRVANTIGLNINLDEYIYPIDDKLYKCKVTYTKNGISDIKYDLYTPKDISSLKIIYDDNISYKYKYTNRNHINNLYDKKDNADDIIIIKNGFVTDTSIANIAIYQNDTWWTPKYPLLEGTTKKRLLATGFLKEKNITLSELLNCKKIALMNAMINFKELKNYKLII
ncbi:MAG: aminotransferase class IV [Campylobacterota bacterium]|nr:aminotransferase class IV [Campylobacterota bacterium]